MSARSQLPLRLSRQFSGRLVAPLQLLHALLFSWVTISKSLPRSLSATSSGCVVLWALGGLRSVWQFATSEVAQSSGVPFCHCCSASAGVLLLEMSLSFSVVAIVSAGRLAAQSLVLLLHLVHSSCDCSSCWQLQRRGCEEILATSRCSSPIFCRYSSFCSFESVSLSCTLVPRPGGASSQLRFVQAICRYPPSRNCLLILVH